MDGIPEAVWRASAMDEGALFEKAQLLGVETSFTDAFGIRHDADPEALALVVEAISADQTRHSPLCDPVTVLFPHQLDTDTDTDTAGSHLLRTTLTVSDAQLVLHDGLCESALAKTVRSTSSEIQIQKSDDGDHILLPLDLPFGCHSLELETSHGSCLITLVCPPHTMSPHAAWVKGAALFVPTYALWEVEAPLPSYGLLGRAARRLGEAGVELLATLPLYAAFLDDPVEPSPYSPASRLHWNETFISEHLVDRPGVTSLPLDLSLLTRQEGRYLNWAPIAARRRQQLLVLADTLDDRTRNAVHRFVHERPDVADFARFAAERQKAHPADRDLVIRSHELAQFLADQELRQIAAADGAQLALDLPIGGHPEGYERWAFPELFADHMSIGAPPDLVFEGGQDWGLPPTLPTAGRNSGHRLWRDLIARAGEHAALVRIDHVMAVQRLWWIPEGMDSSRGVYVRYPREELLAVIAATAAAVGTCVVGENLGTVPEEVVAAMAHWEMLGMYEEQFHMDDRPLPHIPARSVAGIRTHDMLPFRSHVNRDPDGYGSYRRQLHPDFEQVDSPEELVDAVTDRLIHSPAALVQIDLDDLCGITEPHNMPGQVHSSLWSRRLEQPLSETFSNQKLWDRLRNLGARRP
jgi:4-alpha-glucanotransferase